MGVRPFDLDRPLASVADVRSPIGDVRPSYGAASSRPIVAREPLGPNAAALLADAALGAMLEQTARRHPHVINALVKVWADPPAFRREIDALLLDDRLDRAGFALAVLQELADLRDYHARVVAPRVLADSRRAAVAASGAAPRRWVRPGPQPGGRRGRGRLGSLLAWLSRRPG